jgi:hypothetical protein
VVEELVRYVNTDRWAGCSVGSIVAIAVRDWRRDAAAAVDAACYGDRRNPFNDQPFPPSHRGRPRPA